MTISFQRVSDDRLRRFFMEACLLFCILHLVITCIWCFSPYINEYREWAQTDAVLRLFSADAPYSGQTGNGIYLYGFFYPLFGTLFSWLPSGALLVSLRLLSYALTWLAALYAARIVYLRSRSRWAAVAAVAVLLVVDWQNVTGTATPAPLGAFLLLLTVDLMQRGRTLWAALLTVFLFYVKAYFFAAFFPLLIFGFLRSRNEGLRYLLSVFLMGAVTVLVVRLLFPYYFVYNVVHHANAASLSLMHLVRQMGWGLVFFLPFVLMLPVYLYRKFSLLRTDAFLLTSLLLGLIWLRLGMHTGAFMSYLYHLWLPPAVVFALSNVRLIRYPLVERYLMLGILLCPLLIGSVKMNLVLPLNGEQRRACQQFEASAEKIPAEQTLNLSPMMDRFAHVHHIQSADNGQSQFVSTLSAPTASVWLRLFPETAELQSKADNFDNALHEEVFSHRWKYILSDDASIVSEDNISFAGYERMDARILRVGVHKHVVFCWRLKGMEHDRKREKMETRP